MGCGQKGAYDAKRRWLQKNPRKTLSVTQTLHEHIQTQATLEGRPQIEILEAMYIVYKRQGY